MSGVTELHGEAPWKHAGRWIALLVAGVFGVFAGLLALTSAWTALLIWLGFFVAVEIVLYMFSGPLYRPRVKSVSIKEEGLTIRDRRGTETWIPFSRIKRIASSFAACTLVSHSGAKHLLGFGFGGSNGDSILRSYKAWAAHNAVELLEFNSRDGISNRPVKNLEVDDRGRGD